MIPVLVTVLHVIVCLILIVVILIQGGRGQGLTGPSFGGNVQSLLGTRAADVITKITSVAAICFLFTCIVLNYFEAQKSRSLMEGLKPARLDVEAVRKALEKVKTETPTPGPGPAAGSSETVPATQTAAEAAAAGLDGPRRDSRRATPQTPQPIKSAGPEKKDK